MNHIGGFANPVQNLGQLAITMFTLQVLSNIPMAAAKDAIPLEKEMCEVLCSPLPGDKNDAPEIVCQETCKKGEIVTKMQTFVAGKLTEAVKLAGGLPAVQDCVKKCGQLNSGAVVVGMIGNFIPWVGLAVQTAANTAASSNAVYYGCLPVCLTAKAYL